MISIVLARILIPKLGEKRSVISSLLFYVFGFILFGLVSKVWMMYAFVVPFALIGIEEPSSRGIISRQIGPPEQGKLQGALT